MSPEQYTNLLASQNNRCKICGKYCPEDENFPVDHNHRTGEVRGILCTSCNIGLGGFRDNPDLLLEAIQYLNSPTVVLTDYGKPPKTRGQRMPTSKNFYVNGGPLVDEAVKHLNKVIG